MGAIESNAGDHYHLIWTANKAIGILSPKTKLEAIYVEGPSLVDACKVTDEDALLSIDVSEYYNGIDFDNADEVVFSQLKYSVKKADKTWTLSELYSSTNQAKNNSIIKRLADTYKEFHDSFSNVDKLSIKLVSNRKLKHSIENTILNAKLIIQDTNALIFNSLVTNSMFTEDEKGILRKLYETSKLRSREFIGFLKCLDICECGGPSRSILKSQRIEELNCLDLPDIRKHYNELLRTIEEKMLPEGVNHNIITKETVLSCFDTSTEKLFPAKSSIVRDQNYIQREMEVTLKKVAGEEGPQFLCLHGAGGVGKTQLISNIGDVIGNDSIVFYYDCYGGGEYLNPAHPRHTHKNAIKQLCNEMSLELGTPLVVSDRLDNAEYLECFEKRINQAATIVKDINEFARLVLIVDAVDNSFIASEKRKELCFANDLKQLDLPDNVVLIFTSRTERLEKLSLPKKFKSIKITGFSEQEIIRYSAPLYGEISIEEADEIKALSDDGNPRVLSYFNQHLKSNNINTLIKTLKPGGVSLNDIFGKLLTEALMKQDSDIRSVLKLLTYLPRPIPLDILLESTNINRDEIRSMLSDSLLGVAIYENNLHFRDEDFENYLQNIEIEADEGIFKKVAEYVFSKRTTDHYCMRNLHIILGQAGAFDRLSESILNNSDHEMNIVDDEENEIKLNRINTALRMKEALKQKNHLTNIKLVYLLSQISNSIQKMDRIIFENVDLSVSFLLNSTIKKYYDNESDIISRSAKTAAALALRDFDIENIQGYISRSKRLIKEYYDSDKDTKIRLIAPTIDDFSYLGIAIIMVEGTKQFLSYINRWEPFVAEALFNVISSLIVCKQYDKLELLDNEIDDVDEYCVFLSALSRKYSEIKSAQWKKLESLEQSTPIDYGKSNYCYIYYADVIEQLLLLNRRDCADILISRLNPEKFVELQYIQSADEEEAIAQYRIYALRSVLQNKDYAHEELWVGAEQRYSNLDEKDLLKRKNEHKKISDYVIPQYIDYYKTVVDIEDFEKNLQSIAKAFNNVHVTFYDDHNRFFYARLILNCLSRMTVLMSKKNKQQVKEFIGKLLGNSRISQQMFFELATILFERDSFVDLGMHLIRKQEVLILNRNISSEELETFYLDAAQIVIIKNRDLANEFFLKALKATKEADGEIYRRIEVISKASKNYIPDTDNKTLCNKFASFAEYAFKSLDDRKHFPQYAYATAIVNISPLQAIATSCAIEERDDHDVFDLYDTMTIIIQLLLERGQISSKTAIALINLSTKQGRNYEDVVIQALYNYDSGTKKQEREFLHIVLKEVVALLGITIGDKTIAEIEAWAIKKSLNEDAYLKAYLASIKAVQKMNRIKYDKKNDENIVQFSSISRDTIKWERDSILNTYNKLEYASHAEFVQYLFENCSFNAQCKFVPIFLELLFSRQGIYPRDVIVRKTLESIKEWISINQELRDWFLDPENILSLFKLLVENYYDCLDDRLLIISELFADTLVKGFEFIIRHIVEKNIYEPWKLVEFIKIMLACISAKDCTSFLEWSIDEEYSRIKPQFSSINSNNAIRVDLGYDDVLSGYLIKLLGHVEKEKRWYAIHSIYTLHSLKEYGVINAIINQLFSKGLPKEFKTERSYFYIDYAVISLLIALNRIADDEANNLQVYLGSIEKIAFQSKVTNIVIRKLAAILAQKLGSKKQKSLQKACDVKGTIQISGQERKRDYNIDYDDFMFNFDVIGIESDAFKEGYESLARMFNKSKKEITQYCEKHILDNGINNNYVEFWNNEFDKYRYRESRRSYLPNNGIRDYAQTNAMYYVADYLRMSSDIIDEGYDSFGEWLGWHAPYCSWKWLSDAKGLPIAKEQIFDSERYENDGKYFIPDKFVCGLSSFALHKEPYLMLEASHSHTENQHDKRITIISGLAEKSDLEKIKESFNENNWYLGWFYKSEDNKEGFIVDTIEHSQNYAEDSFYSDPYYNLELANHLYKPKHGILNLAGEQDFIDIAQLTSKDVVSRYWATSNDDNIYKYKQNGRMIGLRKSIVDDYLIDNNLLLITQIDISIEDNRTDYSNVKTKPASTREVLIYDGKTEKKYRVTLTRY